MVKIERKQLADGTLSMTLSGKVDERFDGTPIVAALSLSGRKPDKVVLHLAGIRSISSVGLRQFEHFIHDLVKLGRPIAMVHISTAVAAQAAMIPDLFAGVTIVSAKLPFICPACGIEKDHSIPWQAGAHVDAAPACTCGGRWELDGLPEHYLPTGEQ